MCMFKIDTQAHQPEDKYIEPSSRRTLVNDSDVRDRDRGSAAPSCFREIGIGSEIKRLTCVPIILRACVV